MSVHVMNWAWRQGIDDPSAKLVLVKLADSANDDGICWPSQKTLAEHCGLNERSIRYKIERLTSMGLLTVKHRLNDDGTRKSNLYALSSGNVLPMEAPASGNTLPQNRQNELIEIASGNGLPVDCPKCGPLGKLKTEKQLIEHMENVHGEWKATA